MKDIKIGWMTWEEIEPFKEHMIDMELDLMITYHYPEWAIPRSYPEGSVERLKSHIESGNTFFWGAGGEGKILGYYWGYVAPFINKKRWNTRAIYFSSEAKGIGWDVWLWTLLIKKLKNWVVMKLQQSTCLSTRQWLA